MEAVAVLLGCVFFVVCYARGVKLYQIRPDRAWPRVVAYRPIKQLARINANLQRAPPRWTASSSAGHRYVPAESRRTRCASKAFRGPHRLRARRVSATSRRRADRDRRHLDSTIPRGSVVALVGENRVGQDDAGQPAGPLLRSDGRARPAGRHGPAGIEIASLRRLIGVVTQETILFNDTIADNIAYGTRRAPRREQIVEAARKANAHEFIVADPAGYDASWARRALC